MVNNGQDNTANDVLASDFYKQSIGLNFGKSNETGIGAWATPGINAQYAAFVGSDAFNEGRMERYQARSNLASRMGVAESVSIESNGDISLSHFQQVQEARTRKTLGELAQYATGQGVEGIAVPGQLSGMKALDIFNKPEGERTPDEKKALEMFGILDVACNRALALQNANHYADLGAMAAEIGSSYNPAPQGNQ